MQVQEQWEHDRSDWEHWQAWLQRDLDDARAVAGLDLCQSLALKLGEAETRAADDRAALEK